MIGGRRLSQLKVDELKVELERRGLRKSGNKGILIERLQEVVLFVLCTRSLSNSLTERFSLLYNFAFCVCSLFVCLSDSS